MSPFFFRFARNRRGGGGKTGPAASRGTLTGRAC